nr:hypothetical protein Iba_chr12dCG6490 [Ipomoea batatas]
MEELLPNDGISRIRVVPLPVDNNQEGCLYWLHSGALASFRGTVMRERRRRIRPTTAATSSGVDRQAAKADVVWFRFPLKSSDNRRPSFCRRHHMKKTEGERRRRRNQLHHSRKLINNGTHQRRSPGNVGGSGIAVVAAAVQGAGVGLPRQCKHQCFRLHHNINSGNILNPHTVTGVCLSNILNCSRIRLLCLCNSGHINMECNCLGECRKPASDYLLLPDSHGRRRWRKRSPELISRQEFTWSVPDRRWS